MHGPNPLLLVLDFDSTLTTTSTLPEFLSIPTTVFLRFPICTPQPNQRPRHSRCSRSRLQRYPTITASAPSNAPLSCVGRSGEQGLYVAADKLRCLRGLVAAEKGGEGKARVIYVGDSVTDLECLLEADVGIVVRDEGALGSEQRELRGGLGRAGLGRIGWGVWGGCRLGRERVLWWARDFEEVVASGCLVLEGKIFGRSVW
ncbi:hypothetical protein G7Y79_00042g078150 [Physcia stellaris]|nr:hypothetical protein G7Y79_00042g078150 [Physcia stellaris]